MARKYIYKVDVAILAQAKSFLKWENILNAIPVLVCKYFKKRHSTLYSGKLVTKTYSLYNIRITAKQIDNYTKK